MIAIRGAVLGLVVLVASTGCATVARSGANGGSGFASPSTYEVERCEGWYDPAARACDSIGD
jgi:hypothetical protein